MGLFLSLSCTTTSISSRLEKTLYVLQQPLYQSSLTGPVESSYFFSDVAAQSSCILASCIFTGMNGVIVISNILLYEIIVFPPKFLQVSGIKPYQLFPKAILPTNPMDQMLRHECSLHRSNFNHHCLS